MRRLFTILVFALTVGRVPAQTSSRPDPLSDEGMTVILKQRAQEQERLARNSQVFRDFRFSDRFSETGITFTNSIVEDALKHFKPAHYDHGAGVAVADVDNDSLTDIYFVNQIGGNQLWRNLGHGKFENITERAGVGLNDRICVTASFADIDNDGDEDLFVTTVRMGNVLFENVGGGVFREISKSAGVDYSGHSSGAVFFDANNDGFLDLFVCTVGVYTSDQRGAGGYYRALPDAFAGHTKPERFERSLLYINQGNRTFKEMSREMDLNDLGFAGDASLADVNGDGFPDLYVLNMQGDDSLYLNEAGHRFRKATGEFFSKTPWGSMGLNFLDFDQDGQIDLYVTDMHSDMSGLQTKLSKTMTSLEFETKKSEQWCTAEYSDAYLGGASNNVFGNALYVQIGVGKSLEISEKAGAETFWPWGMSVADLNADGYPDVFITAGMGFGFRYGPNSLLLNDAGKKFVPAELITGVEPREGNRFRKTGFVLDCSGADKDHPLCRGRSGLTPVSEVLSSRSSVIFDLDGDGDLDIVATDMDDRPQVLINNRSAQGGFSWVQIKLQGTRSNRDALGAIVRVRAGGRDWFRQNDGKSGYLAQSSMPLYFGLNGAKTVEEVEVRWPSGRKQVVPGGDVNRAIKIVEAGN